MLDTIEQYILAILPAATAIITAIAALIKIISSIKTSKENTEAHLKKLHKAVSNSVDGSNNVINKVEFLSGKVDTFLGSSYDVIEKLEKRVASFEKLNKDLKTTLTNYENKIQTQNEKIIELEKRIIEMNLEDEYNG